MRRMPPRGRSLPQGAPAPRWLLRGHPAAPGVRRPPDGRRRSSRRTSGRDGLRPSRSKEDAMETRHPKGNASHPFRPPRPRAAAGAVLAFAAALLLTAAPSAAKDRGDDDEAEGRPCSATARAAFRACGHDAQAGYWNAVGACTNVTDAAERKECLAEAKAARREEDGLCREQLVERRRLCAVLGQDRYDPDFDPENFEEDFQNL